MSINISSVVAESNDPLVESSNPRPKKKSRTVGSPRISKKRIRKRIRGTKFFLTFPQCNVEPKLALTRLLSKYPCKWIVIARESHADGTPHLHLVFWLKKRIQVKSTSLWDFIAMKHGNYQVAKKIVNVVKYVTKGNDYLSHGIDVQSWLKSKATKKGVTFEVVATKMKSGESIEEIDHDHPGMVLRNLEKLQRYSRFLEASKRKQASKDLQEWVSLPLSDVLPDFYKVGSWLNKNLYSAPRFFKMKQLWIWGCTNLGKTSLIMNLMKFFRVYWVPLDTAHLDDYEDAQYDLIVFDEFKGQKSITWMNNFIDGSPKLVYRRYVSTMKLKNHPVIVLSNYDIDGAYAKVAVNDPSRLDTLKARFEVVNVVNFIKKI